MRALSQHYFRRGTKQCVHWRIDRWLKRKPDLQPARPFAAPSRNEVRIFGYINRLVEEY